MMKKQTAKQGEKGSASWLPQCTSEQLQEKQHQDPNLAKLIKWLEDGYSPTTEELYLSSSTKFGGCLTPEDIKSILKILATTWQPWFKEA